jgi:AraC-like DNA-binding protein
MAAGERIPGQIVAVPIADPPWSPWLRLAHLMVYEGRETTATLRRLKDWELVLQLDGEAWIWWERWGASQPLPAGHMLLTPPGEAHAQGLVGSHLAVHFDLHAQPGLAYPAMAESLQAKRRRADGPIAPVWRLQPAHGPAIEIPAVTRLAAPEAWRERFAPLVRQWLLRRHQGPAARLQAAGILAAAVHDLAAEREPDDGDPARVDRDLSHLLSFLDLDGRRWTVAGLARRAGLGETAFRAAFRRLTGESPRAWLERHRFERARHQLLTTSMAIQRIAAACGYDDPFHFSRVCRRLTGMGPRELRRRG